MSKTLAAITGVNGWVPETVLTNFDLEKMVDTNDEWIRTRTGIRERRILREEGKGTSYMGTKAVEGLLEKTNTNPEDIDLVLCATITPDMPFPATANLISNNIGAVNAFGYDISAACSGFLYALQTGAKFIESGQYQKVIVVGGDKMSSIIDYTDRTTCVIFGDGAGAVLLEPTQENVGVKDAILRSDGSGANYLRLPAGGSAKPASHETVDAREHFVFQEGRPVFKMAVTKMPETVAEVMERNNLTSEDINWLVPHQANQRIIDVVGRNANIPAEKVMVNIDRYGNTTAGTLPLCLWEYEKQLKKGDEVILTAFGGGFTWGSIYLTWAYDGE